MGSAASNHQNIAPAKTAATGTGRPPSGKATSKHIDKELQKEKLEHMNTFKILLLGFHHFFQKFAKTLNEFRIEVLWTSKQDGSEFSRKNLIY